MTKASSEGSAGLAEKVRAGDRRALARAITLIESTKPQHAAEAEALLEALLPASGESVRIGITGVPGVGKSTFIERFSLQIVTAGYRVARSEERRVGKECVRSCRYRLLAEN